MRALWSKSLFRVFHVSGRQPILAKWTFINVQNPFFFVGLEKCVFTVFFVCLDKYNITIFYLYYQLYMM